MTYDLDVLCGGSHINTILVKFEGQGQSSPTLDEHLKWLL